MNPNEFFGELKRRNVYKVAVAYVAARAIMNRAASHAAPKEPAAPAPVPPAAIGSLVKAIRPQKISAKAIKMIYIHTQIRDRNEPSIR